MKIAILFFVLGPSCIVIAQKKDIKDSLDYVIVNDLGVQRKVKAVQANEILIIDGDSIYNASEESQLRIMLMKKSGFDVINDPDSIQKFLMQRIKAIIIVKEKER